jgi:predicted site-specific integrase-resolvase
MPPLVTVKQLAANLQVSPAIIRALTREGAIRPIINRGGPRGRKTIRFDEAAVREALTRQAETAATTAAR